MRASARPENISFPEGTPEWVKQLPDPYSLPADQFTFMEEVFAAGMRTCPSLGTNGDVTAGDGDCDYPGGLENSDMFVEVFTDCEGNPQVSCGVPAQNRG